MEKLIKEKEKSYSNHIIIMTEQMETRDLKLMVHYELVHQECYSRYLISLGLSI